MGYARGIGGTSASNQMNAKSRILGVLSALLFADCSRPDQRQTLSPIDAALRNRSQMNFFARQFRSLDRRAREKAFSMIELIDLLDPANPNMAGEYLTGSTWRFSERFGGIDIASDFLVFPKPDSVSAGQAVFVVTPRALQVSENEWKRIGLTHALEPIELTENEFFSSIRKLGSIADQRRGSSDIQAKEKQ